GLPAPVAARGVGDDVLGPAVDDRLPRRMRRVGDRRTEEIAAIIAQHFPGAEIAYEPHPARQAIVDSWPEDVVDHAARRDWGWQPEHDLERAFSEYLVPRILARHAAAVR
ncbi:MAG: hypothetical protein ACO3NL_14440, partial [Phycisphaerales bacterium]